MTRNPYVAAERPSVAHLLAQLADARDRLAVLEEDNAKLRGELIRARAGMAQRPRRWTTA